MLVGQKDPDSLVAEIKMTRTLHDGAFLVVEGKDDVRFWTRWRHKTCEIVDGEGKCNVTGAVKRLDTQCIGGVLGIVDDDYDSLEGLTVGSDNLVATDAHDLECLLCRSSALDVVLAEFGDSSKIGQFEGIEGVDVRVGLLERTLVFGRLRWAALHFDLNVDLDALRVARFVNYDTWDVDGEDLIRAAVRNDSSDEELLRRRIAELAPADPWCIARGHDMVELLRIGLMHVLGNISASVGPQQISQVLRAAIPPQELQGTTLWTDVRKWESGNPDYAVLAP